MGTALVRLPTSEGDREDVVTATLSCDGCASASPRLDTVLTVTGAEPPALAVTARWIADRQQVELTLSHDDADKKVADSYRINQSTKSPSAIR